MSSTFDIEDPFAHKGAIVILEDPSFTIGNLILDLVPLNRMVHTLAHEESIDAILVEQIVSPRMEVLNVSWCVGEDN